MRIQNSLFQSPVGLLQIKATDDYIVAVLFSNTLKKSAGEIGITKISKCDHPLIGACEEQLAEYFIGHRTHFELPVCQDGTEFQQKVWSALTEIPYGRTISYLQLSKRIGDAKATRAVGTTNGKNAISIIVPCHRVIGSNGSLSGYSGDLWRKKWLLEHEAKNANGVQTLF